MKHKTKDIKIVEKKESEPKLFVVSASQLAILFDVTDRTITDWNVKKGCPKIGHGKFDMKAVLGWWLDNVYEAGQVSPDAENAKDRYWMAKAEHEEIKVATAKSRLISEEQIIQEWSDRLSEVTSGLVALSRRLPPMLDGKTKYEQMAIIDDEVWKLRDNFCRTGRFTPQEVEDDSMAHN